MGPTKNLSHGYDFGGTNQEDTDKYLARLRRDRVHQHRSAGQKRRQARERLYGKQSHLVIVRKIGDKA